MAVAKKFGKIGFKTEIGPNPRHIKVSTVCSHVRIFLDVGKSYPVMLSVGSTPIRGVSSVYTDGISEAFDINKKQYGLKRLREAFVKNRHLSALKILEAAIEDVRRYIGTQRLLDDITLVVLKQK